MMKQITPWTLPVQNSRYTFASDNMPMRHNAVTTHGIGHAMLWAFAWIMTVFVMLLVVITAPIIILLTFPF